MATKQPSKRKTASKSLVKPSDWLNFSSAVVIAVIASILYYTGWVYTTHWYSYYGLDASQISLPLQLVLIHGIPGLFLLIITSLTAILGYAIYRAIFSRRFIDTTDIPHIVYIAYIIAISFLSIITIILIGNQIVEIPPELLISFGFIIFLFIVNAEVEYLFVLLSFISGKPIFISELRVPFVMPNWAAWLISWVIIVRKAFSDRDFVKLRKVYSFPLKNEVLHEIEVIKKEFTKNAKDQKVKLQQTISRTKNFWIGAILLFYFLISVSLSAVLGEWDAMRGRRLMIGNWHIPKVSVYSTSPIPVLKELGDCLPDSGCEYKSLGLLASDEQVYFLVDWKNGYFYSSKPNVYIIPRNDNLVLSFIVSPFANPTATPLPTKTPTLTLTPNISPVTLTPTP